ncbi:Coq4 family protein [Anabaena sp. CCY 9910]|uniref:Coq4 family protein n=1 Tax=Anabaena sp. CCY 9910 TaxID=3103870 RepID=UPI0039E11EA3
MQSPEKIDSTWEDSVIDSFISFVRSYDGDFTCIYKLAETVSDEYSLQKIIDFLSSTPQGKQAFQQRPRLGVVDLPKLHQLPTNTLGYVYADQMLQNNLQPLQSQEIDNDYQFFKTHITETHDLWHIVTGADTSILGEIQLEAFYVSQLYASRFWLALLAKNLLKAVIYDIELSTPYMDAIATGWVMAKQAKPLFGIEWNLLWEKPLADVRTSLNIILPAN